MLDRGRFTQRQLPRGDALAGTYTVKGEMFTMNLGAGTGGRRESEQFAFRWSLYRGLITFSAVPGKSSPEPFRVKPWRRIRDVP